MTGRAIEVSCAHAALARLIGWTEDAVVLNVRALQERDGTRVDHTRASRVAFAHIVATLRRAGFIAEPAFPAHRKRVRYAQWAREYGWHGNYLCCRHAQVFAHTRGQKVGASAGAATLIGAYRIVRVSKHSPGERQCTTN